MRAVIQLVSNASVSVDKEVISSISRGLMVLIGIADDDTDMDMKQLSKKILSLRVFSDPSKPETLWKKNVQDVEGEILCVSQFTLMANTAKGNKPDFHRAMGTEASRSLYSRLLDHLKTSYQAEKIKDGKFGAMMSVNLTNEGPITLILDSRKPGSAPSI